MFSKILVANRGEIAVKIIEVCKKMKIKTVAVYSEADKDSLHVKVADESYCIGPANMQNSYFNINAILTTAIATKAEAIHPGYGMLSENCEFAAKCEENNICFIGPRSDVLKMMCNKIEIKKFMKNCGVPVIPGTCVGNDINQVKLEAEKIGYPVVIKIQNGGGGRGIKIVYKKEDIEKAANEAICEGEKFSKCDKIYIEKYLSPVKHIELQVVADKFKNIVILGERDCSIQVNNQKIIEEAPCYSLDQNLRNNLLKICTNAMKQSDYFGLGTLEFLMDEDKNFYFMEMNCRIQVEYPITQLITGINIIKTQIEIAASKKIEFKQSDIKLRGHAIECRINLCRNNSKNIVQSLSIPDFENVEFHT